MIVRMRRLDLLLLAKDREAVLAALEAAGAVHVEEREGVSSEGMERTERMLRSVESTLGAVRKAFQTSGLRRLPPQMWAEAGKVVEEWQALERSVQEAEAAVAALEKEEALLTPWGEFDPELLSRLGSEAGVTVRFFEVSAKEWRRLSREHPDLVVVGRGQGKVRAVLFERGVRREVEAEEVRLPGVSLSAVRRRLAEARRRLEDLARERQRFFVWVEALERERTKLSESLRLEAARLSCGEAVEGKVLHLSGWVPVRAAGRVERSLAGLKVWFALRDPEPGEEPPVLVENGWFSRKFEFLLKMYALPGYREIDPTPFFAPFFTLFVGLCMGDFAYGAVVFLVSLALTLFVLKRPMRWVGSLGMILGLSVMVSGVLLNSFFGLTFLGGPGIEGPAVLPTGGRLAVFAPSGGEYPMMSFALLVGFVQLSLAFVLRIANTARTRGVGAACVPLSYLLILYGALSWAAHTNFLDLGVADFAVAGVPFGSYLKLIPEKAALAMMALAVPLNVAFSNADRKGGERWTMVFIDFYNGVTGLLSSILSYIRLFALGLTGGLLGAAFNQLALMPILRDGVPQWFSPGVVATVLILLVGHALNFLLACVGAFVHPLRLTYVEFLQNMDYAWNGRPYRPLARGG